MRGNSSRGNREIPQVSAADGATDRSEKVQTPKSDMYACGKSDDCIVPEKPSNNDMRSTEMVEGRRSTEGNTVGPATSWTQSQIDVSPGLHRVREAAQRDKRMRFTTLLHHVTVDLLRRSFRQLRQEAAPGVDDLTWDQYELNLEERIGCLLQHKVIPSLNFYPIWTCNYFQEMTNRAETILGGVWYRIRRSMPPRIPVTSFLHRSTIT